MAADQRARTPTRGRARALGLAAALVVAAVTMVACTAGRVESAAARTGAGQAAVGNGGGRSGAEHISATGSPASGAPSSASPAGDVAAIEAAVGAINATAGGPVDAQRKLLQRLVAPEQAQAQQDCPTARSTLAFQPAYGDLRQAPPDDGASDSAEESPGSRPDATASAVPTESPYAGTAYLLPTFITIYTGDRITGTDLTTLHLWVAGGTVRIAALCVS